jgi:nucleotide-binding universal stress UspA family protein
MRKFFFATDIDKPTLAILEKILDMCRTGFGEIVVLHSTSATDWEERLHVCGIKSRIIVEKELSAPHIFSTAQDVGASMIAVSFNEWGRALLTSSIIKKLVKICTFPILLINNTGEMSESGGKGLFGHVIFATDWSPASWKAFEYLLGFKERIKELEIVHVISKKLTVRDLRLLKEKLRDIRNTALNSGIDAEYHIYVGKVHEEIMLAAKDYDATMIVMGTTRKSTIREVFRGSPSYRMAEETSLPTLVVP